MQTSWFVHVWAKRGLGRSGRWLGTSFLLAATMLTVPALNCTGNDDFDSTALDGLVGIKVLPARITIHSSRDRMRLLVTGRYHDGRQVDLTREARLTTTNPDVVQVDDSLLRPTGDGTADLLVRIGDQECLVPVNVRSHAAPAPVSFKYEVLPLLTKHKCNSGACHGSPSGKGGFRLSLQAYDHELDKLTLVREAFGRRTNVFDSEQSLLLKKPSMRVSHGGGLRLPKRQPSYAILKAWIAEGCRFDEKDAPQCVRLEVLPTSGRVIKRPAHEQQLLVLAHFSDGSARDVTHLASFSSSDDAVASVDTNGLVTGHDRGEVAVMVRFLEKVESCFITFVKDIDGFRWNDPPAANYIDKLVFQKLKQLKFAPSELCTDDEFLRRIYLDTIGVLPTHDETTSFLQDTTVDKRAALIDRLLQRPEHARFWALKWGDILRLKRDKVTAAGVHKYYQWIVRALDQNMPYDQFCRDLLLAQGSTFTNPAANYFRVVSDTDVCTETTAQLFLGVRIQCAKCHNHPFERWTQDNYYGLAAFFNRVKQKKGRRADELVVWVSREGEVVQPRTGEQMKPWLPRTGKADEVGEQDRRQQFVDWLTRPDNPFFARVAVNRMWANLLGVGIVDPVDDFRDSNPPSNSALLDALANDFINSGFDRRHILRTILNSRTYQLSSRTHQWNKEDTKYFSHAKVRMLSAEQLLDAICHVTGVPEQFEGLPAGTHATQLPSPDVQNEFLKVFGQPERGTACACERSTESSLSQALQLFNGPVVHAKLTDENNRLFQMVNVGKTDEQIVNQLHVLALCRRPTAGEFDTAMSYIQKKQNRIEALQDVCWALLNMNEFLFQH